MLGHDVKPVPKGSSDEDVAQFAKAQRRVLLTHDRDFADSAKFPPSEFSGIVLFRLHPPTLERVLKALERLLLKLPPQSLPGKLVIVSDVDAFDVFPPASQSPAAAS
mgnify:FL=1